LLYHCHQLESCHNSSYPISSFYNRYITIGGFSAFSQQADYD